jgi:hypothetical protein
MSNTPSGIDLKRCAAEFVSQRIEHDWRKYFVPYPARRDVPLLDGGRILLRFAKTIHSLDRACDPAVELKRRLD